MKKPLLIVLAVAAAATVLWMRPPAPPQDEVVSISPADTAGVRRFWTHYRTATRLRLSGRLDAAAAAYEAALALDDRHEDALYYLGNVQRDRGDVAAAEAAWLRLAEINPNSARAYHQLGNLYLCRRTAKELDPVKAEDYFRRALALNKEETGPVLRLGEVALVRGDLDAAADYLAAVLATNHWSVEATFLSGYLAWKQGDAARAGALFAQALHRPDRTMPVPGEGDTRGAGPMTDGPVGCSLFQPVLGRLAHLSDGAEADPWYHNLDSLLTNTRITIAGASPY